MRTAKAMRVKPAEAASMFVEVSCLMMPPPLDDQSAIFVLGMVNRFIEGMHTRRLAASNCIRAARLYAYARGASGKDAHRFALRSAGDWDTHGFISGNGTKVSFGLTFRGLSNRLPRTAIPLLDALEIEFDAQAPLGLTADERKDYADRLATHTRSQSFVMFNAIACEKTP